MTRAINLVIPCLFLSFFSFEIKAQTDINTRQIYEVMIAGPEKILPSIEQRLSDNSYVLRRFYCEERGALYLEVQEPDASELLNLFRDLQLPCYLKKSCDFERFSQVCSTKANQKD
jgi:hypothetical protein